MKIEIYSDIACPWCYIGKARFERALERFAGKDDVDVVFRPYQLDPTAPERAVAMYDYLAARFGANARGMAARVIDQARGEGLVMDYDRGLTVNTLAAHRLLRLAEQEHGAAVQRAVAERLFRAHFAEGKDVGDPNVLADIAAESGMSPDRVRAYLDSGEGTAEVRDAIDHARQLGITAVPTFVFDDRYALQGAQPTKLFAEALNEVAREGFTARG